MAGTPASASAASASSPQTGQATVTGTGIAWDYTTTHNITRPL